MPEVLAENAFLGCSALLPRVEGAFLDCVSDDLALLLATKGVADIRSPFAADWRFDLVEPAGAVPRVDLPPSTQDELLAGRTGWRPRWRPISDTRDLRPDDPIVVIGDAFHLPWLPYHGHEHMAHGFVLAGLTHGGLAQIVDPYDNATQWGRAEPLATEVPLTALRSALDGGRWASLDRAGPANPVDPDAMLGSNAAAILAAAEHGAYQRFLDRHRPGGPAELENLALQCWLLARNRALHARWRADLPVMSTVDMGRFGEVAAGWRRASEMAYLALRRVRSGRQAPTAVHTALRSVAGHEVALAEDLLTVRRSAS